jgi:uncharacterized membrane protein YtjA (UPF0391 family)
VVDNKRKRLRSAVGERKQWSADGETAGTTHLCLHFDHTISSERHLLNQFLQFHQWACILDQILLAYGPLNQAHHYRHWLVQYRRSFPDHIHVRFCRPTNIHVSRRWTIIFLIIALIAGVLGFAGVAGAAVGIARILFVIFLILFLVSLILRLTSK